MNFIELLSKYNKFIIISGLILAALSFIDNNLFTGMILIIFLLSLALFFINRIKDKNQAKILNWLFLISLLIHVLAVLFVFYTNFQPFSGGRGDYTDYNFQAQAISQRIHQGNFSIGGLEIGHYYPVIVGYLYALTIPSMLMGELLNAWFAAIMVIFVYLIVCEIGGSKKGAFIVGLIAGVYPSFLFFSSLLLKDDLVVLLCTIGLFITIKIIKNFSWGKFLILYAILIGLTHFRIYIGLAFVLSFIVSWFIFSNLKIKKRIIFGLIMVVFLGFSPNVSKGEGAIGGYFYNDFLKQYLTSGNITYYREIVYAPPNEISENQETNKMPTDEDIINSGESSSVIIKTGLENPYAFVKNTFSSFLAAFLGPYPWQIKYVKQLFILPETIAWYLALFFIIQGIIKNFRQKYKIIMPLVIFGIVVLGVLALFMNNYGIVVRIRMPAFLSLLCLLPLGLKKINNIKIPFINSLFNNI